MDQAMAKFRQAVIAGIKDYNRVQNDLKQFKNDPNMKGLLERNKDCFAALEKQIQKSGTNNYPNELAEKTPTKKTHSPPEKPPTENVESPKLTKSDLARSRMAIGLLKAEFGQDKEASRAVSEALTIREELVKSDAKNRQYQEDLATAYSGQASLDWRAGRAAEALRRWQQALDLLASGVSHDPGNDSRNKWLSAHQASLELAMGLRYAEVGLWPDAAEQMRKSFTSQPSGNANDWVAYSILLLVNGEMDKYRKTCSQMLQQFEDTPIAWLASDMSRAVMLGSPTRADVSRCLPMAERGEADEPTAYWRVIRHVLALYRAGKFQKALQAVKRFPDAAEGWPLRALIHHKLNQRQEAKLWLNKCDVWSQQSIQAALTRNTVQNPFPLYWWDWAAIQILRREAHELIEGRPESREHPEKGRAEVREHPGADAPRLAQSPGTTLDDPWQRLLLGSVYAKLGLKEKADGELHTTVHVNPKDFEIWMARIRISVRLGQLDRAEADLAKAIEENPKDCRPWIARGRFFMEHGQQKKADADLAKAATLTPNELNKFIQAGWWLVGPYPESLQTACPPEKDPDPSRPVEPMPEAPLSTKGVARPESSKGTAATNSATPLHWKPAPTGDFGRVDLRKVFDYDKVSSYALTYVYSPEERPAVLWVGGDDYIRVWLNGRLVHEVPDTLIVWAWGLNRVPVTLRAGRNTILVKVTNVGGAYGFHLRLGDYPLDRAFDYAKLGLWKESAEQFAKGLARGEEMDAHPERIYAQVLASAGDWDGFRRQFARVYDQWGNTQDKNVGYWIAISLNVAPWEPTVGAQLLRLTENGMNPNEPWRKATLAAACYRVGQYDRALQLLKEWKDDGPITWALRALCHFQLGQKKEARKWLDKLNQWHDKSLSDALASKDFKLPMDWHLWGYHLVLWREANRLIAGAEPKDGPNELALRARALKEVTGK